MRLTIMFALAAGTCLAVAVAGDGGTRPFYVARDDGTLAWARGLNKNLGEVERDLCGIQNIGEGQITPLTCKNEDPLGGFTPGADCIDCGTQTDLQNKPNGYRQFPDGVPKVKCDVNVLKKGRCWRDGPQYKYECQNLEIQRDGQGNPLKCQGQVNIIAAQPDDPGGGGN